MTHTDTAPVRDETALDYDELVSIMRTAVEHHGVANWTLGDAAVLIETHYGEKTLPRAFSECGCKKSKGYACTKVSRLFDKSVRAEFVNCPTLFWSHFESAAKTNDIAKAREWLHKAADNSWSSDALDRAMTIDETGEHLTKLATVDVLVRDIDIGLERIRRVAHEYGDTSQMRLTISWVAVGKEREL